MASRAKFIAVLALVIGLFMTASSVVYVGLDLTRAELQEADDDVRRTARSEVPFLLAIKDIKIDVIQVQQWLSDVSATRTRNGDGFDQAEEYARKFAADVARAREIATALGLKEGVGLLDEMEVEFKPYYETGRKMAQAYVSYGPEQGNRMMGDFDRVAERLGGTTDKLVAYAEAHTQNGLAKLEHHTVGLIESYSSLVVLIAFMVAGVFVLTIAGAAYLFRQIGGTIALPRQDLGTLSGGAGNGKTTLKLWKNRRD